MDGSEVEEGLKNIFKLNKVPAGLLYATARQMLRNFLEIYCKSVGLQLIWMQFSNVYGVENRTGNIIRYILENILNNKEVYFEPAQQPYDLISVNDLTEAVYPLGANDTKRNNYFREIGEIAGKDDFIKIGVRPDDGIRYSMVCLIIHSW